MNAIEEVTAMYLKNPENYFISNGQVFILKPESAKRSALDIAGIDLGISTKEIVEFIREGRERQ